MRRSMLGVLAVLACVPAMQALDDPRDKPKPTQAKPTKPATPAEELQALREEFDKSQQGAVQALRKAKTDEERQKAATAYQQLNARFADRFLRLAEKNGKDASAFDALAWVVENAQGTPADARAADRLAQAYLNDARMSPL